MSTARSASMRRAPLVLIALSVLFGTAQELTAQNVYYACYAPLTGAVYRIKVGTLRQSCFFSSHVEFSWTDGANAVRTTDAAGGDLSGVFSNANVVRLLGRALSTTAPQNGQVLTWNGTEWIAATPSAGGGATDHGALTGLADDDHPQYLLTNGVRFANSGFAVSGTGTPGAIPSEGPGARLMWYTGKSAFRAGRVPSTQWDDVNIGHNSVALGWNVTASGFAAVSLGGHTKASGSYSTALGNGAHASGEQATALGSFTIASGAQSTALGSFTIASGAESTAMGTVASTNGHHGAFVYGDASSGNGVSATVANQFVVRAQHFWFGTNNTVANPAGHFMTTSTGAYLSTGGAWTNASDIALKRAFGDVNADEVLQKIADLSIRSWSYKAEDPAVRHIGPTAQDFRAAFGLGVSETSIATVDADGISLLGIQALEKRTRLLQQENLQLRAANLDLHNRLDQLEAAIRRLEQR